MLMDTNMIKALQRVNTIILDIDHVINHYDEKFAFQFSLATACCAIEMMARQTRGQALNTIPIKDLINLALRSYKEFGNTCILFEREFGLDPMELFNRHHARLCEEGGYIDERFKRGELFVDPDLRPLLEQIKCMNIKIIAFTNGDEQYAHKVLGQGCHGIDDLFDHIYGLDSFGDNKWMYDKRHGVHWINMLDKAGLRKEFSSAVGNGVDPNWKCPECLFVDDAGRNHLVAQMLGMQTALVRRNIVVQGPAYANYIISDVKGILSDVIVAQSNFNAPHQSLSRLRA